MIKDNIKIIKDLTKIFLKSAYQDINIINKETKKINKRSVFVWLILIVSLALFYISNEIIKALVSSGYPEVFLSIYFLVLAIFIMFQTILVCTNIFYFSKDIELILPFPIKPVNLLIAKFNTLICTLYVSEAIFGIIPICIYGILTHSTLLFYIYAVLIFIFFPVFLALVLSIIMMFVMKISKFIKNKEIFQTIITLLLVTSIFIVEYNVINNIFIQNKEIEIVENNFQIADKLIEFNNKIETSNKLFLVINPAVKVLKNSNLQNIFEIIKIILIDFITFIIFIFIGKKTYLKDILKNTSYLIKTSNKRINLYKKCKKNIIFKAYIKKEIKNLFRNSMVFMQCVYPMIISLITVIIISIILLPKLNEVLNNPDIKQLIGNLEFDLSIVYIILSGIQVLFMISPASLTSISRDGKNASFMKYIPISYFRQILYKGLPQIFINSISVIIIVGILYYAFHSIGIVNVLLVFISSMILNALNSYSMIIVDLLNPKLEWDSEYEILKQNNNRYFQYAFTVIVILILVYLNKVLEGINLNLAIIITSIVFLFILIIELILIKIRENKLMKKIN
jgi:ABC-2 type transport system permease protein